MFESLRYRLPNYDMYDNFWGSSNATGNFVVLSANPHLSREEETPNFADEVFEDDITMNTGPQLGDKRPRTLGRL